ncbi:MAG TPA: ATP-dependent zinc metalloprotease FtsH [Tepidisphaeraceae bacterium]|nr:ATP-dependent zinc metalloprotease FtsH [Tepidisphaeraceae bacterium]
MAEQRPSNSGGGDRPNRKPNRNTPPGLRFRGLFGWILFIGLAIMFFVLVNKQDKGTPSIALTDLRAYFEKDVVRSVTIEGDDVHGEFTQPQVVPSQQGTGANAGAEKPAVTKFTVSVPPNSASTWLFPWLLDNAPKTVRIDNRNSDNLLINLLVPLIPWLLIFGFIWFFVFRQLRNSSGAGGMLGNFGRSKHRITSKEHTNVTFDDVAGVEEAKDEVMEIVEFLKNPKKFQRLGGRIPRGVLLVGEPGTGKTLLAKAIAGEADVPFFSISGSDFVEMFVGVGASRVRDLFKQAKDNSPCIIFLDEIDAVGRRRGSGFSSGGHDEREQTLNAILVEMDGFDTNDQVIVVASTNRVDVLDPALTRPGRFDRQVTVPLPDVKGRLDILRVHSRKVKLGPNVDLARLAKATPGFSGADLAAIINEAALGATLAGKEFIEHDDMEEARDKVRWGRAKKSRVIDEKDKVATAYHEAGHAVVQHLLRPDTDPIHKVTIIPRGNYGGATMALPEKDRTSYSKRWCTSFMKVCFAGRIAEEMFCGDINTGAQGDIRQATGIARKMVRDWGMNDRLGFVYYGEDDSRPNVMGGFGDGREYSEDTAKAIDEEIKKLVDALYEETRQILEANRDRVEAMAKALMKYETLDSNDVDRIMRGDNLTKPTVSDLLANESNKGNDRRATTIQPGPDTTQPDVNPGFGGPMPSPG